MDTATAIVNHTAPLRWARIRADGRAKVRAAIVAEALRQLAREIGR